MMLTLMLTSKGVAAVPRASLVILSGTLADLRPAARGRRGDPRRGRAHGHGAHLGQPAGQLPGLGGDGAVGGRAPGAAAGRQPMSARPRVSRQPETSALRRDPSGRRPVTAGGIAPIPPLLVSSQRESLRYDWSIQLFPALSVATTGLARCPEGAGRRRPRSASAPIANVRTRSRSTATPRSSARFKVTMPSTRVAPARVLLSLPAWTPGAYEITNFARWVSNFTPTRTASRSSGTSSTTTPGASARRGQVRERVVRLPGRHARQRDGLGPARLPAVQRHQRLPVPRRAAVRLPGHGADQHRDRLDGRDRHASGGASGQLSARRTITTWWTCRSSSGRFDFDSAQVEGIMARLATYPAGSLSGAPRAETWTSIKKHDSRRDRRSSGNAVGELHDHA